MSKLGGRLILVGATLLFMLEWNTNLAKPSSLSCRECEPSDILFHLTGPRDCTDISGSGERESGEYYISTGGQKVKVFCDLKTPNGGWLVFQRRTNGKENFYREWKYYQKGFGILEGEFWLGNEILHKLTSTRKYKLRIELEDFANAKRYAEYSTFSIGSSATNYKLTVSGFTGNAGDSLARHNGMQFSAKDSDYDIYDGNCAQLFKGGWWYDKCHYSNLNGLYLHGPHDSYADGIEWYHWKGYKYSLKFTEMKIALAN